MGRSAAVYRRLSARAVGLALGAAAFIGVVVGGWGGGGLMSGCHRESPPSEPPVLNSSNPLALSSQPTTSNSQSATNSSQPVDADDPSSTAVAPHVTTLVAPPIGASADAYATANLVANSDTTPVADRQLNVLLLNDVKSVALTFAEPVDLVNPLNHEILLPGVAMPSVITPGVAASDAATRGVAVRDVTAFIGHRTMHIPAIDWKTELPIIDIMPTGPKPIRVKLGQEWRAFPGSIRLIRKAEGGGIVVNRVDIETYLVGVVSAELPANFQPETFRAQAIACRTYAWYARQTLGRKREWDVTATEKSQVYRGLDRVLPRAVEAVNDTTGIVCTWPSPQGEKIFCTYFSSRCGGTTTAAPSSAKEPLIPPLAGGVACEYCRGLDAYRWPQEPVLLMSTIGGQLAERFSRFSALGRLSDIKVAEQTADGRVLRLTLIDEQGRSAEVDGETFRLTVDPTGRLIQSSYFSIATQPADRVVFTNGRGFGHGIGMCQYGAEYLASQGWDAAAILQHYYPTSHLTRAY